MNILEFLVIYLAVGAPFGMYFFFQKRRELNLTKLWLKSFLTVVVWIPYGFKLLHDFATNSSRANKSTGDRSESEKLNIIKKRLSQLVVRQVSEISIFEFREVLERYGGLTLACNSNDKTPCKSEMEIFRISLRQDINIGANCLHRRNYLQLKFHQNLARKEFLEILAAPALSHIDEIKFLALEFVSVIKDPPAQKELQAIFDNTFQSPGELAGTGKEEWNSKEPKIFITNQTTAH